jgi:hypothetical protein
MDLLKTATDWAKAEVFSSTFFILFGIGFGLFFTNKARITQFEKAYNSDAPAFVQSEISRAESTLREYKNVVFTAVPLIIAACALVIIFVNTPIWRASMITTIDMLVVILLVDGTAHARIEAYNKQLVLVEKQGKVKDP